MNNKFADKVLSILKFTFKNFDTFLGIILAVIAIIISNSPEYKEKVIGLFASMIGLLAISLFLINQQRRETNTKIESLNKSIERIIQRISPDSFFKNKTSESNLIKDAKTDLFIIQETGNLIAERCRQELLTFLKNGGRIKWISVLNNDTSIKLLSMRNANLNEERLIEDRMNSGNSMLDVLSKEAGKYAKNIEVRYIPYPIDFTAVLIDYNDKDLKNRQALIRLQGFRITYDEKLDFMVNSYDSSSVFDLYLQQINNFWLESTKCIFLTGKPGVGKSTLLQELIKELKQNNTIDIIGFTTSEIKNNENKRIGFETTDVKTGNKSKLAEKENDEYTLINDTIYNLINPILDVAITAENKLLIIDEIGPIQLQNSVFMKKIGEVLKNNKISILGIVSYDKQTLVLDAKKNIRAKIINLESGNYGTVYNQLKNNFMK